MKTKSKRRLKAIENNTQLIINEINNKIENLGHYSSSLYDTLIEIQRIFDKIRNIPSEQQIKYTKFKKQSLKWKNQVDEIEKKYSKDSLKTIGTGAAGASLGIGLITMGPSIAMGLATSFGVASTGTVISTLSGAAATNAALAWIGGGALAAGGGGIAAGDAFLALTGPIGWSIAGISILSSGLLFFKNKKEKERLYNVFKSISDRDICCYELAIVEIEEKISRIIDENKKLQNAISRIKTFGIDYDSMSESQQYELGSYVNLMFSSMQLLVIPITNLSPKFSNEDFDKYLADNFDIDRNEIIKDKKIIIELANLLYKIDLEAADKKVLYKSLKKSIRKSKIKCSPKILEIALNMLEYKYINE